jgi:hypothetical protein
MILRGTLVREIVIPPASLNPMILENPIPPIDQSTIDHPSLESGQISVPVEMERAIVLAVADRMANPKNTFPDTESRTGSIDHTTALSTAN